MRSSKRNTATLDTVLPLAQQLTLLDKVRLIESLLPEIKGGLATAQLANEEIVGSAMKASEPTFARIWDNEEDAEYDNL
jgi:hypothetical protein